MKDFTTPLQDFVGKLKISLDVLLYRICWYKLRVKNLLFFCRHQDVAKCIPGQSLRISVEEAARFLSQAYESDFEVSK